MVCAGLLSPPPACSFQPEDSGEEKVAPSPKVFPLALIPFMFATVVPWAFACSVHTPLLEAGARPAGIAWSTWPGGQGTIALC